MSMATKYKFNPDPPKEALDYFKSKGLRPGFDYRDVWQREHHVAFTVAKMMRLDLLEFTHAKLIEAKAKGKTLAQFKKEIKPELVKKGWWGIKESIDPVTGKKIKVQLGSPRRLKIIYQVNMRTARAVGQWERITRNRDTHPYLIYELGPSQNHRDEHVAWSGLILPLDDSWWSSHYPPNGFGCKCRVRAINKRQYKRLKVSGRYLTKAPKDKMKTLVNKRTGQTIRTPVGVHPAFNYHIGQGRESHLQLMVRDKVNAAMTDAAVGIVRQITLSPVFEDWFKTIPSSIDSLAALPNKELKKSMFVVASMDNKLQKALKAKQRAVALSAENVAKQKAHHDYKQLTFEEYQLMPTIINQGRVILKDNGKNIVFFHHLDRKDSKGQTKKQLYELVIKTTRIHHENYILSFHRAKKQDIKSTENKGRVIRD